MPLISVIVPVYKVEPYLHRCVDSILNQSFEDFELILVDDGSTDNCPAICDEYARNNNRVIVIHKKNGGLSSARNRGLDYIFANSNSEYVSFIDSDDWVDKDYLSFLYDLATENNVDVVMCGVRTISGDDICEELNNSNNVFFYGKNFSTVQYVHHIYSTAWAKLYKKSTLKGIRFLDNAIHEDEYFINDYYPRNMRCLYNSSKLYFYFLANQNSIMNNLSCNGNWYAVDALIKRYKLIKKKSFEADLSTKNTLLQSLLKCYSIFVKSIPSRISVLLTSFRVVAILPNKKTYVKAKIKLLIGSICYVIGLKRNRIIIYF